MIIKLAGEIAESISNSTRSGKNFSMLLSGGSTPKALFEYLASPDTPEIDYSKLLIFWGDERMVPPEDLESNYGVAFSTWLSKVNIPSENIFRIKGEEDIVCECLRYEKLIETQVLNEENEPRFDLILLGLGEDGHTASIFPGENKLFHSDKLCAVASHPAAGQKRITVTGRVINNAKRVIFLVSGESKSEIVNCVFSRTSQSHILPASMVKPYKGYVEWYLDRSSAKFLILI